MKLKGFTDNNNIILYLHYSCVILPTSSCYFECAVYAIAGSQNRISGQWSGEGKVLQF